MRTAFLLTAILSTLFVTDTAQAQSAEILAEYERRIDEQQQQLDALRRELHALKADRGGSDGQPVALSDESTDSPEALMPTVLRKNEHLEVTFGGRVHRMLLTVDDGANTDAFFTDSEQGPTMLRFDATGRPNDRLAVGGTVEVGVRQSRAFLVSQDNPDPSASVNTRIAEVWVQHRGMGRFSLGRGSAASWLAPEVDLSGTQFASLLPVGMLAPGMKFVNVTDDTLSNVKVRDHFADVERLIIMDRARYDSPRFGFGLQISGTVANDSRWDVALRAKPAQRGNWTLVGGASYQHTPFMGIDHRYDAAISARHEPSGLNLTLGGVKEDFEDGRDANTYIVKFGWLAKLFSLGPTAFSADYHQVKNLRLPGDKADSIGVFAVQKWPRYGLDLYAGYRRYEVNRSDIPLKPLDIYVLGVGFSF